MSQVIVGPWLLGMHCVCLLRSGLAVSAYLNHSSSDEIRQSKCLDPTSAGQVSHVRLRGHSTWSPASEEEVFDRPVRFKVCVTGLCPAQTALSNAELRQVSLDGCLGKETNCWT